MNLKAKSYALRKIALNMVYTAKTGHIGGDFSVIDILNVLYNRHMNMSPAQIDDPDRDRFILSKGHSVEALYAVLSDCGYFPESELATFSRFDSNLIGHPTRKIPGVEMNSGSLGHGLPVASGMAIAAKMDGKNYRVYTIMGDGELAEGSVWESAMLSGHYKLDNLTAIIDRNKLQISGGTEQVMAHENLADRWKSFGWNVIQADGNDIDSLDNAFTQAKNHTGSPTVIIANTTKGCGVSFMENIAGWHHRVPTADEYKQAVEELSEKEAAANAK